MSTTEEGRSTYKSSLIFTHIVYRCVMLSCPDFQDGLCVLYLCVYVCVSVCVCSEFVSENVRKSRVCVRGCVCKCVCVCW